MTIFRPRPILALCGAACLIAFTPYAPRPPEELGELDQVAGRAPGALVLAPTAPHTTAGDEQSAKWSVAAPLTFSEAHPVDLASTASAAIALRPSAAGRGGPERRQPRRPIRLCRHSRIAAACGRARFRVPFAPALAPAPFAPPPPPRGSEAAVLYNKGDAAGLAALAKAADDSAERLALEWASLRADAHPSFASLAAFFGAHPSWPSSEWIRGRQEAELAAHAETPAKVAAYFASAPPESSAGEIAAARAANAAGRADEAAQIIRALWRDGDFDAFTESVIIREFGPLLAQADHKYRADRLFYADSFGAAMRAAALAGSDVLALAEARIEAARAPLSAAVLRAVPPALRNDPSLTFAKSSTPGARTASMRRPFF